MFVDERYTTSHVHSALLKVTPEATTLESMKKTVDSQRDVSLPPNSFYKFSLPARIMAPTLRTKEQALKNTALEQVDVNKNTGTGTTNRTAKKRKVGLP